jgi:hypothetical protein
MALLRRVIALVLVSSLGGCSSAFLRDPVVPEGHGRPACVEANVAPGIDTTLALVGAVGVITGAVFVGKAVAAGDCGGSDPGSCGERTDESYALGFVSLIPGAFMLAFFGVSAKHGFERTGNCRAVHRDWDAQQAAAKPAYLP